MALAPWQMIRAPAVVRTFLRERLLVGGVFGSPLFLLRLQIPASSIDSKRGIVTTSTIMIHEVRCIIMSGKPMKPAKCELIGFHSVACRAQDPGIAALIA